MSSSRITLTLMTVTNHRIDDFRIQFYLANSVQKCYGSILLLSFYFVTLNPEWSIQKPILILWALLYSTVYIHKMYNEANNVNPLALLLAAKLKLNYTWKIARAVHSILMSAHSHKSIRYTKLFVVRACICMRINLIMLS